MFSSFLVQRLTPTCGVHHSYRVKGSGHTGGGKAQGTPVGGGVKGSGHTGGGGEGFRAHRWGGFRAHRCGGVKGSGHIGVGG